MDRLYTLSPERIKLVGHAGQTLRETVVIVPEPTFPFTIEKVRAKRGGNIAFHLSEIKSPEGSRFELTVENTRTETGPYFDTLFLTTDNQRLHEIEIQVFGNIRPKPDDTSAQPPKG